MPATFLRSYFLAELVLCGALSAWLCQAQGWWLPLALPLTLALLFAVRAAYMLLTFACAPLLAGGADPPSPIGPLARVLLLLRETLALTRGYYAMALAPADESVPPGEAPLAVLVHGWMCNGGAWRHLRQRLEAAAGVRTLAVTLGPPLASIDRFAAGLAARLRSLPPGPPVWLVCHSMGGLVARRALADPLVAARVRGVITLGSPHHGTALAWLAVGQCTAEMRPGSAWLQALAARGTALPAARFTSVWSRHDNFVTPRSSSRLPGAQQRVVAAVGHLELLYSDEVAALVVAELLGGDAGGPA